MTHKFSKFLVLAIGALGLSALPALADSPCPTASLATYLADFSGSTGCTVTYDGVTLDFSQFSYTPGGSTQEAASSIGVSEAGSWASTVGGAGRGAMMMVREHLVRRFRSSHHSRHGTPSGFESYVAKRVPDRKRRWSWIPDSLAGAWLPG